MTMIERVARALCAGDPDQMLGKFIRCDFPDGRFSLTVSQTEFEPAWMKWVGAAKQAIDAMREPTQDMIVDGMLAAGAYDTDAFKATAAWQAMINVARQ